MNRFALCLAQGFYIGRIPFAPGTFGSLLGVSWVFLLLATGRPAIYLLGMVAGILLSVWVCGKAERILGETDPPSVVLDEVAAMPLCFAGWLALSAWENGTWPGPFSLFGRHGWVWTAGIFAAFRLFDISKPWPVRQSQALPGGWGVTVDDLLAGGYVNLAALAAWVATRSHP